MNKSVSHYLELSFCSLIANSIPNLFYWNQCLHHSNPFKKLATQMISLTLSDPVAVKNVYDL
jgi:hypothetical protein